MQRNNIFKLFLAGAAAFAVAACDREESTSVLTRFEPVTLTAVSSPEAAAEAVEDTITFEFALSPNQVNEATIDIAVSPSSTATEGEDFELSTHSVDLLAFEGQDGFSVDVYVHEDFTAEGNDPETIVLTLSSANPSGFTTQDVQVGTIVDSQIEGVDFTLRWEFVADEPKESFDVCSLVDVDLTVQEPGNADMYETDLMGYAASTTACPEHGVLSLGDMEEGVPYELWVANYGGTDLGEFGMMNVYVDFAKRGGGTFAGTVLLDSLFDVSDGAEGGIFMTIEKNGDVLTLTDLRTDEVVAEGRAPAGRTKQIVKKEAFSSKKSMIRGKKSILAPKNRD